MPIDTKQSNPPPCAHNPALSEPVVISEFRANRPLPPT